MARKSSRPPGVSYTSTVTSALLICVAVAIALLGNIRLKSEQSSLEVQIMRLERAIGDADKSNAKLQLDYEQLISQSGLDQRIRLMRLQLNLPGNDARIILPEPVSDTPPPVMADKGRATFPVIRSPSGAGGGPQIRGSAR